MDAVATTRNADPGNNPSETIDDLLPDKTLIPLDGIAVYIAGTAKPVFLNTGEAFIIGRKIEETSEPFLDLTNLGGYLLGLSRRHAKVRRTALGYEILDLSSTNGTWLNDERLIPHKPYPLTSGSQLRLGRMRFVILFRTLSEIKQKA
jgi:pSer/pThr/pTyr-binding forkhead associated (FHA) protein